MRCANDFVVYISFPVVEIEKMSENKYSKVYEIRIEQRLTMYATDIDTVEQIAHNEHDDDVLFSISFPFIQIGVVCWWSHQYKSRFFFVYFLLI